ncbi:MAG: type II toxin-antitoxin system VapC family toxin [Thermodesulfobacteriota bacterium]
MILVIDTSAAAEIVLQREDAERFVRHIENADWVITPTIYIAEIANVFWKYHAFQNMLIDACEQCMEDAVAIPDDYGESYESQFRTGMRIPCLEL